MRKGPILFVDHATGMGGAEHSLLLLMARIGSYGWQPHLACAEGSLAQAARRAGVPVETLTLPRLRRSARFALDLPRGVRAVATLSAHLGAAAIYANTVRAALYGALAARMARRPFIWHMRDFWLSESRPSRLWLDAAGKRLLLAAASGVIANSKAVAGNLPPSHKVRVVLNGIDLSAFAARPGDGKAFRAQHSLAQDALLVGSVGRLRPWKGQDRFLRVAARVAGSCSSARFVIAGGSPLGSDDDYGAGLQELARSLGIAEKTVFTGQLEEVQPALAALALFVHTGEPEPFGLVNVEAMAAGLPVVAFAHGALPEIVADGESGLLVAPGDESGMARAIVSLLQAPAQRQRMGEQGRARAAAHFSIERTVRQVDEALQHFLGAA